MRRHAPLAAIAALAAAVRALGLFWGLGLPAFLSGEGYVAYHADEPAFLKWAAQINAGGVPESSRYPKGFPAQLALADRVLGGGSGLDPATLTFLGRMISLAYGTATVVLLYFLAYELCADWGVARLAALLLALSGLHATDSHFCTADAGNTFWIYATFLFSLLTLREKDPLHAFFAVLSCGLAIAFKFSWVCLIPLLYLFRRLRPAATRGLLLAGALAAVFVLGNGGHYGGKAFLSLFTASPLDAADHVRDYSARLAPFHYLVKLPPALGLVSFLAVLWSLRRPRDAAGVTPDRRSAALFVLALPLLVQFALNCFWTIPFPRYPFPRHLLPLMPALAYVAAHGLTSAVSRVPRWRTPLLAGAILYQLVYACAGQYYYLVDTRKTAIAWMQERLPLHSPVLFSQRRNYQSRDIPALSDNFSVLPYDVNARPDVRHVLVTEAYYRRYFHAWAHPFTPYPQGDAIFHGNERDRLFLQALFKGELPYRQVKAFRVRSFTPEMALYKRFFGTFQGFIGDTLLFSR